MNKTISSKLERPDRVESARGPGSPERSALKTVWGQLSNYFNRVKWLSTDVLRGFWPKIMMIVLFSASGVASAAAGFGGAFLFLKHLQDGSSLSFKGIEIAVTGNEYFIFTAILVMGLASGGIIYYSEWLIAAVTTAYHKLCVVRLFEIISNPEFNGWQRLCAGPTQNTLMNLSGNVCKRMTISIRRILQGILPFFIFIFAAGSMVYLDPFMTLIMIPFGLVYLVPLYRLNKGLALQHQKFLSMNPEARKGVNSAIKSAVNSDLPYEQKISKAMKILDADIFNETSAIFFNRDLANDRVHALNTSFFFICLFGLFLFINLKAAQPDWAKLLAYLVALRFTLNSLRNVTSTFIILSRFSPEYKEYIDFVNGAGQIRRDRRDHAARDVPFPDHIEFHCGINKFHSPQNSVRVRKGQLIWVLQPDPPGAGVLKTLASRLEVNVKPAVDLFTNVSFIPEPCLHSAAKPEPIISESPAAFINANQLTESRHEFINQLFTEGKDRFIFLVSDSAERVLQISKDIGDSRGSCIIIINDGSITGCGEIAWLAENRKDITSYLCSTSSQKVSTSGFDPDDDSEE